MRHRPTTVTVLLLALAAPAASRAQADSSRRAAELWAVYNGRHAWSSRWALLAEGQWRRTDLVAAPKQLLLRTGVRYAWRGKVALGGGYTYLRTSPYGPLADPIASDEHRAFEQLEFDTPAGRLALSHRLRAEQRWQQEVDAAPGAPRAAGRAYSNRGRYQLRATRPLHAGATEAPGWYATATGEPFLRWGRGAGRTFDQSRAFAGLGYRWGDAVRVEGGYLHQHRRPAEGGTRESNHVLQLSVYSEAPLVDRR